MVFSFHPPHAFQCTVVFQDCMVYDGLMAAEGWLLLGFQVHILKGIQNCAMRES